MAETASFTGRCYCGKTTFEASQASQTVAYCHCDDCRRFTGAPVSAFAAFEASVVSFEPDNGREVSVYPGAHRSYCASCGSPLASRYDYLPDQIYVGVGIIDQADQLKPEVHAYDSLRLSWLHINDDIERFDKSSRERLNEKRAQ